MSSFGPAYILERKHEGYHVDNPNDKGKKTYAGIASAFYPNWSGWPIVYAHEAKIGRSLKTNEQVPGIEPHVEAFYKSLWDSKGFGAISNQDVANIVYDWFINSGGTGIKGVQRVLNNSFGKSLSVDGAFGQQTATAINSVDPVKLNNAIKQARTDFYYGLVQKDPTQAVFLKGWLNRINSFPTLSVVGIGLGTILFGTGIFFLVRHLVNESKKKKHVTSKAAG